MTAPYVNANAFQSPGAQEEATHFGREWKQTTKPQGFLWLSGTPKSDFKLMAVT